jgi:lipid-A-disaccharide synthase-like uncharacterized protein
MESDALCIHSRRGMLNGLLLATVLCSWHPICAAQTPTPLTADPTHETSLRLRLNPRPEGVRKVQLATDDQGRHWYVLINLDGSEERLDPDAFATRLGHDHRKRRRFYSLLNITSPAGIAWVVLGLAGQVLFAGRMIVQWAVSERRQRSVVPVAFWWMSLGGASMLLIYFIWRRDIVGVLGQATGWMIYCRNLIFITKARTPRAD